MIQWLLKRLRTGAKYDTNEYARRFLAGDDLPASTDGPITIPESAMTISAVYAAVTILSRTIASLPLDIYEKTATGQREAPQHPLSALLRRKPNRHQTAYDWKEQLVACLCLRGNAISLKRYTEGQVTALVPVHPARVQIEEYADDRILYVITDRQGNRFRVVPDDVLHHRGLCVDGYWGVSPIAQARDSINLAKQVQKYGIGVFESRGAKRVVVKFPNPLGEDAYKRFKESWLSLKPAETAILEEGGDATTIGMNADEAQYLETRRMTVADVARIFNVPLVLLAEQEKTAAYASTEQFDLMFGKHTIRPLVKKLEARLDSDLIADPRYFCKFNMDALLRADVEKRTAALKTQFEHGVINGDEWRAEENRNPTGEEAGRTYFVPSNLVPAQRALEAPKAPAPQEPGAGGGMGGSANEPKSLLEPIAKDLAERIVNKEIRELPKAGTAAEFRDRHRVYIYKALRPLFAAAGIEDQDRREALATELAASLAEGQETDPENRQIEIFALLMGAISGDPMVSLRWHVAAAAARSRIDQAAADRQTPEGAEVRDL